MKNYRPTRVDVNLRNLAFNFRQVRNKLSHRVKVMVCVKADAYGHGLIPVSKKLVDCKVDYLSIASIDEGIRLREAGIKVPVLVLGMILKNNCEPVIRFGLEQVVCAYELARQLNATAQRMRKRAGIHIKVDTGMGRIGVLYEDAFDLIKKISRLPFLDIQGVCTHLACADMNPEFTLHQIGVFNELILRLEKSGLRIPFVHAANSIGAVDFKQSHFTMVRPGLIMYGLYPRRNLAIALKPVLSLKTKVVYVKQVPAGYGISYGHTYVTKRKTSIATLPIGYGDGYSRHLSNCAPVLIKGKRFTVSGRVCMDQIMVDVGNEPVKIGDEAVLIGRQGKNAITAEELAELAHTIPYEVVCSIGERVPRFYT